MNPSQNSFRDLVKEEEELLSQTSKLNLPAPRLQLTWEALKTDWSSKVCVYTLVLPLDELDVRREISRCGEWHAVLGRTECGGGGYPIVAEDFEIHTPFRDSAHALWDSKRLFNIPVYVVCENQFKRLYPK